MPLADFNEAQHNHKHLSSAKNAFAVKSQLMADYTPQADCCIHRHVLVHFSAEVTLPVKPALLNLMNFITDSRGVHEGLSFPRQP